MKTKTIVLHIGYPKTGTSALQWFLHTYRENLGRQGVCYPLTGQVEDHAHHRLAFSLKENAYERWAAGPRARLFAELRSELDTSDADTVVLSSELFLDCLEPIRESSEFGSVLKDRPVRVICFLRRQATFLESLYRQFVWDPTQRFADGPEALVKRYPGVGDYYTALCRWAGFIGRQNIESVVYEQARNAEGCIRRFCRLVGIDTERLGASDFDMEKNVFPRAALGTEVMRIANACENLSDEQRRELVQSVGRLAGSVDHLPLPRGLFSADLVSQVEAMYLDSNRKLADEFVRQPLEGCWFREKQEES